jgi:glutamine amidotransferase
MIVIIDLGISNVASVSNMIRVAGIEFAVTRDPKVVEAAERLVIPGVGAFDEAMSRLEQARLLPVLHRRVLVDRVPVLGVCLGMQLLSQGSDEGTRPGLGWVRGRTRRFDLPMSDKLRIPHMGWNTVSQVRANDVLRGQTPERYYFAHSYFVECDDRLDIIAQTSYGVTFTSAVQRGHIWGVQFHPEKSHTIGMQVFKNFAGFSC